MDLKGLLNPRRSCEPWDCNAAHVVQVGNVRLSPAVLLEHLLINILHTSMKSTVVIERTDIPLCLIL